MQHRAINAAHAGPDAELQARGWNNGEKVGGIDAPHLVELPASTFLFRGYGGPSARADGRWWMTPLELALVLDSAGHGAFDIGQFESRSVVHAVFAILSDFGNDLLQFDLIQLDALFLGYFGQTAHATTGPGAGRKAPSILVGGRQRRTRQLFIPEFRRFARHAHVVQTAWNDAALGPLIREFAWQRLPFET